jgi:hypothetical protein
MPSFPAPSRLRLIPILLAQAFGIGCGVAGVKLNSTLVPPEVLGVYGVFLTFAPVGAWVVHAGLLKFVARHWAGATSRGGMLRRVALSWARRLPWLAVAAVVGAWALPQPTPGAAAILGLALFGAASLLAAVALAQTALQAEGAHWRDCGVSVCASLSRTFLPLILFAATGGAMAALWVGFAGHALITAIAGAWALQAVWRRGENATGAAHPSATGAYGGPMFIALAAATWVLAGLNRWIVAAFFGPTEAGYFTLAGGAAVVLVAALGAVFVQYFQPGIFALGDRSAGAERVAVARRVDQVALAFAGVGIVAVGTLALVSPWLVGPLISEKYRAALPWIFPAGCFGVATITTVFYQSLLLAGRREAACAPVELATAAMLVAGCVGSAALGPEWFARWLIMTPLVPWLLTRPLARRFFS